MNTKNLHNRAQIAGGLVVFFVPNSNSRVEPPMNDTLYVDVPLEFGEGYSLK